MLRSAFRLDVARAAGALLFGVLGCSQEAPESKTCTATANCLAGQECSGGQCIAYTACSATAPCPNGAVCDVGICRSACTSDAQCQPLGLTCDEANGRCVPAPNPAATAGSGGSAGAFITPAAGTAGSAVPSFGGAAGSPPQVAGATSLGGTSSVGSAGAAGSAPLGAGQGGTPAVAGQAGQGPQAGTGPSGGSSNGGSGGTTGTAGTAGMGMAGRVNPPGECKAEYTGQGWNTYNGNGSITFYTFQMGTMHDIHCSYGIQGRNPDVVRHTYTGGGRYFAAMNTADYRASAACGACVEVSSSNGKKVVVTVVDECPIGTNPKCTAGHLDLSREAFLQIANERDGHVGTGHGGCCQSISWKYVPCPVPETQNVTFRLKEPDNQYYTTVVVQDHKYPITSVQINGQNATRQPDNFWIVGDGNQAPGPWSVRATDVNNWIYESTLEFNQSGDVSSGSRAMCQ